MSLRPSSFSPLLEHNCRLILTQLAVEQQSGDPAAWITLTPDEAAAQALNFLWSAGLVSRRYHSKHESEDQYPREPAQYVVEGGAQERFEKKVLFLRLDWDNLDDKYIVEEFSRQSFYFLEDLVNIIDDIDFRSKLGEKCFIEIQADDYEKAELLNTLWWLGVVERQYRDDRHEAESHLPGDGAEYSVDGRTGERLHRLLKQAIAVAHSNFAKLQR
ncbi:hypothetical protein [Pseudoroseomonas cervicalis]|uniref:hypothetical protein n=1 Tax=Teichococcus cervicalis TaxID=204525 RepID=UPI0022F15606|nr:hypothetical protein [Pseudoroseomonas cervicalis]WBV42545.1 hypothetical protein PFY06_15070 [Pseudoroseomonas cervicalis]